MLQVDICSVYRLLQMELAFCLSFLKKTGNGNLHYRGIHFTAILLICTGGRHNLPLKSVTEASLDAYIPGKYR